MRYKRYRLVYYLKNGKIIQDIKEFYYRDKEKMLKRVLRYVRSTQKFTAIDYTGSIISIGCNDIVKVELNYLN